ncbi:helix-turn-helix transcriptional regulator [Mycobacterium sp.]|uniref:helix-turn-helix transcriptional regulator n=1 Tax=Mycobacterium sp. TaxID=1785 RepID=UPI003F99E14A
MKRERDRNDWSQADLSKLLQRRGLEHIYPTTVAKIESGERAVRIDEAAALADLFGVSVDALLGRGIRHDLAYILRAVLDTARRSAEQAAAIDDALSASLVDLDALDFKGRDELEEEILRAQHAIREVHGAFSKVTKFRLPPGFRVILRKSLEIPETRTVLVGPEASE